MDKLKTTPHTICLFGDDDFAFSCIQTLSESEATLTGLIYDNEKLQNWASYNTHIQTNHLDSWLDTPTMPETCALAIIALRHRRPIKNILEKLKVPALVFFESKEPKDYNYSDISTCIEQKQSRCAMTWSYYKPDLFGFLLERFSVKIDKNDTSGSLMRKTAYAGKQVLAEILHNTEEIIANQNTETTKLESSPKAYVHGILDWQNTTETLIRKSKALNFWPYKNPITSFKIFIENQCYLAENLNENATQAAPGELIINHDTAILGCSNGAISFKLKKLSGKTAHFKPSNIHLKPVDETQKNLCVMAIKKAHHLENKIISALAQEPTPSPYPTDIKLFKQTTIVKNIVMREDKSCEAFFSYCALLLSQLINKKSIKILYKKNSATQIPISTEIGIVSLDTTEESLKFDKLKTALKNTTFFTVAQDLIPRNPNRNISENWFTLENSIVFLCQPDSNLEKTSSDHLAFIFDSNKQEASIRLTSSAFSSTDLEKITESIVKYIQAFFNANKTKKINQFQRLESIKIPAKQYIENEKSLPTLLTNKAASNQHNPELYFNHAKLTFAKLNTQALNITHHLNTLNYQHDQKIALIGQWGAIEVAILLACIKLGASLITFDKDHSSAYLEHSLRKNNIAVAFLPDELKNKIDFDILISFSEINAAQAGKEVLNVQPTASEKNFTITTSSFDQAYLRKTNRITQSTLNHTINWISEKFNFSENTRILVLSRNLSDLTLSIFLSAILKGHSIHFCEEILLNSPAKLVKTLKENKINVCYLPDASLNNTFKNNHLKELEEVTLISNVFNNDSMRLHHKNIFLARGLPNANTVVLYFQDSDDNVEPSPQHTLFISDKNLEEMPLGAYGKLATKYNKSIFVSGFTGFISPSVSLHLNQKHPTNLPNTSFTNLSKIEQKILQHPHVLEAMVTLKQLKNISLLTAYIVPNIESKNFNIKQLKEDLKSSLPYHQIPSIFMLADTLPTHETSRLFT